MKALIVVDVQRDFCEGGNLAVSGGTYVAEKIAAFIGEHDFDYHQVVATKDWHFADNDNGGHFTEWPVHCVAESLGSRFQEPLDYSYFDQVFYKGEGKPAYSGFEGEDANGTNLREYLDLRNIDSVDICGLALDYCVKATALDSVANGFKTRIIMGLTAAVSQYTQLSAEVELAKAGVNLMLDNGDVVR